MALGIFGGFGTISMAMLVAATPKEQMSRSIGTLQTVQIVSAAVGPIDRRGARGLDGIRRTCLASTAFAAAAPAS